MTESFASWCDQSRMRWAMAGAFLVGVIATLIATGLRVEGANFPNAALAGVALAGITARYRQQARAPQLSATAEALLLWVLIMTAGILLSYAAATSGMPYRDAEFHAADMMLGFDWQAYAALIDASPTLTALCRFAYTSLIPQTFLLVIALAVAQKYGTLHRFLVALVISLAVTCISFALAPAVSVYEYMKIPLESFENLRPISNFQHVEPIAGLRSGDITIINLSDMHGLITFPSFHACGAILLAWGFWSVPLLRVPALVLNGLMLMSTPTDGAHYLVDIIAGVALAGAAIWLSGRLGQRSTADHAVAGQRPAAPDRRAAQREAEQGGDGPRHAAGQAGESEPHHQRGGKRRSGDVKLGAHQDGRLASQHITDNAA